MRLSITFIYTTALLSLLSTCFASTQTQTARDNLDDDIKGTIGDYTGTDNAAKLAAAKTAVEAWKRDAETAVTEYTKKRDRAQWLAKYLENMAQRVLKEKQNPTGSFLWKLDSGVTPKATKDEKGLVVACKNAWDAYDATVRLLEHYKAVISTAGAFLASSTASTNPTASELYDAFYKVFSDSGSTNINIIAHRAKVDKAFDELTDAFKAISAHRKWWWLKTTGITAVVGGIAGAVYYFVAVSPPDLENVTGGDVVPLPPSVPSKTEEEAPKPKEEVKVEKASISGAKKHTGGKKGGANPKKLNKPKTGPK